MTGASHLKNYFFRLYKTLLENHINSTSLKPSEAEEDCVKAFCVLAHAALEEYFEILTKETLHNAYMKYKSKQILSNIPSNSNELAKINKQIIQLIETLILASNFSIFSSEKSETLKDYKSKLERVTEIYKNGNNPSIQDLNELTKRTDSYVKEILKETKRFFDNHIESNHGASLKYLLRLLIPVGIDIPNDIKLNSLQKLAEHRGNFAHTKSLQQVISASDIILYAKDIITLCFSIEKSVDDFTTL